MNILEEIIQFKKKEVEEKRSLFPTKLLEKSLYFGSKTVSLKKYLTRADKSGVIAEIKRKSPSKGIINAHVNIERTSIGYMQAGASALSILTDTQFFGGKNEDLTIARKFNFCPILRKDFVIDEYQIIEAKSIGADAILLIAAVLDQHTIQKLATFAKSLGLEVLVEVHNEEEVRKCQDLDIDLMGVNNRNLKTFEVDVQTSKNLSSLIPDHLVKVSESGITDAKVIHELKEYGFEGFLIGEQFMKSGRPERACARLIRQLSAKTTINYAKA